jgi:uncharacterized protein (DUF2267 family)
MHRTRLVALGAAVGAVAVLLARPAPVRRMARRGFPVVARKGRYWRGRLAGARYRLLGGRPDPDVADDVLADRVRSSLGAVTKRLDMPRVHVMVNDHVAVLTGVVPSEAEGVEVKRAVEDVPGVRGVASLLHVGMGSGDSRPSEGRSQHEASPAYRRLTGAAGEAGVTEDAVLPAVRAVVGTFALRLPPGEREHLLGHLPADARALAAPPQVSGEAVRHARTIPRFVALVAEAGGMSSSDAEAVTHRVLRELRELVPEEARDVKSVLPADLKDLWDPDPA